MIEDIRKAASESLSNAQDIRQRVHDLTLHALKSRRFDRHAIRDVVRAVAEGMTRGAPESRLGVRHALAEGLRGLDEALTKSVEAGHAALRQVIATGRGLSDDEVKQALAGLRKVEEDFISTVDEVAHSANERVRPELRQLLKETARAGTDTGRRTARLMAEFALAGAELTGEFSRRFAQIASGVLAGMADALEKRESGTKTP